MATYATDAVLDQVPEAICVVGEGEEPLTRLVEAWTAAEGHRLTLERMLLRDQVPNLVFQHSGANVRTQRSRALLANAAVPVRSMTAAVADRSGILRLEASRGCAWGRCSFCAIPHKYCDDARWEAMPDELVIQQLEHLSAMGIRSPYFTDEDFVGSDPLRTIRLAKSIEDARQSGRISSDMTLYLNLRATTIVSKDKNDLPGGATILRALKQAGLREVFVGVESGTREQTRRFTKPVTRAQNLAAIRTLQRLGISLDVGFIMFDPQMTLDELSENLRFIDEAGLRDHDARLTKALRVEPGTSMADDYAQQGLLAGPIDLDSMSFPYRWREPAVAAVHDVFETWEDALMDPVYAIQAATRGEVGSERLRSQLRGSLGLLRTLDLDVLDKLVSAAGSGLDPAQQDLSPQLRRRDALVSRAQVLLP